MHHTKREASPEVDQKGDPVCKRLKEETTSIKEAPESETTTNNNNNSSSDKSTNDKSQASDDTNNNGGKDNNDDATSSDKAHDQTISDNIQNGSEQAKAINGDIKSDKGEACEDEQNKKEDQDTKKEDSTEVKSTEIKSDADTAVADGVTKTDSDPIGTILICGGANWEMTGRKELPKNAKKPVEQHPASRNLWAPHRICLDPENPEKSLRVSGAFSGCNACHSVIVTEDGKAMTFGRNEKGQLGLGDYERRDLPTYVEALKDLKIVAAACGRSHTLFLTSEGHVYACGDNKMGQLGINQPSAQQVATPTKISFKENKPIVRLSCGAEFSLIVDIDGALYSFGHPEHGQLGHNSENKYFTTGNKYAFHCEHSPRRIVAFIEKSREGHVTPLDDVYIIDIACGTNHALAVDKRNRCYSWGFGGYHRLGHSETKNEFVPRSIKTFDVPGRGVSRVFCGATHSMALDLNGVLYFWGQNKSSGEATMYPKPVQDLCGWKIRSVACANRSIVVAAEESCISWGPSPTYGELGYGEGKSKSSTTPQEVRPLEGIHIMNVECGYGHTLMMARDSSPEEVSRINNLRKWP